MKKIHIVIFVFSLSLSGSGYSQDRIMDLQECLNFGLENSYLKQSKMLETQERELEFRKNISSFYPQIDAYGDYYAYFNDLPTYIFPPEESAVLSGGSTNDYYPVELGLPHNLDIGLKIDQVIYDHNFFLSDKFRDQLSQIGMLQERSVEEEIIFNISQAFYQAASVKEKITLIDFNLERLIRIEKMLEVQIKNGFAREVEKGKIEINRLKLMQSRNQAESGYEKLLYYLKFLMGMPVEEKIDIRTQDISPENTIGPDTVLIRDNTRYRLLDSQEEINQLEKEKKRNEYLPQVNAFAHFRLQAQREAFNFFNNNQDWFLINLIGIRLDIPVMHGGRKKKEMEISEVKDSQIDLKKKQLEESLKMDYKNGWNDLENGIREIEIQEQNLQVSNEIYEQSKALFEEGLMLLPEFLETEAALREAEMELNNAKYQYKIAELKYLKATGNLLDYKE